MSGKLTPQVAGQTGISTTSCTRYCRSWWTRTNVQRDASGQVTGFTGGTGVASYQPYLDDISQQQFIRPSTRLPSSLCRLTKKKLLDTTLADFDRQAQIGQQTVSDNGLHCWSFWWF